MKTMSIKVFGNSYTLSEGEIDCYKTLLPFLQSEEKTILTLRSKHQLLVREDLLILFIHMYFHRFAIPYFQITQGRFPVESDAPFLKEILYYCMAGRAMDDLVDNDSRMFKQFESALLLEFYCGKLHALISQADFSAFRQHLIESGRYESRRLKQLSFGVIEADIYNRIRYFFVRAEKDFPGRVKRLKQYMGVLLGGLDLNDAIADGRKKESATVVSNNLYKLLENDEGKILLDATLFKYYVDASGLIHSARCDLLRKLNGSAFYYTANVLRSITNVFDPSKTI
jgi:hypothetical protein